MCVRKKGSMCVCVCAMCHVPRVEPTCSYGKWRCGRCKHPAPHQASAPVHAVTHTRVHTHTPRSPASSSHCTKSLCPGELGDSSEPPTRTGEATQHTMKMADLIKDIRLDPKPPGDFLVGGCAVDAGVESCLDTAAGFRPLSRGRALLRAARARLSLVERCDLHGSSSEEEDILHGYQITWQSRSGYLLTSSHAR